MNGEDSTARQRDTDLAGHSIHHTTVYDRNPEHTPVRESSQIMVNDWYTLQKKL